MAANSANRFSWLPEEEQIRKVCRQAGAPGECLDCPVLICGMARVPVLEQAHGQEPSACLEAELADYIAYLLLTAEGWPTGLDIEGFSDRRMWPDHPVMRIVADIIDLS